VVSYGQVSKDVGELQKLLIKHGAKITADNSFGPATKKAVEDFQRANGLVVGSPVGDKMWGMLYAEPKKETAPPSPSRPTLNYLDKNENVKLLQALLNKDGFALTVDGSFGPGTLAAVNSFQKRYSLPIKNMVDLTMWQKLEEVTSGKKSIYSKIRRFSSDVHVLELPQEDYFVDLEHGELSKMERPSTIANNLRKQSRDVIAAVNYGFFGGNQEQLGSWLDEGSYKKIPHPDFIDVIYHKNGKLEVKNFTGHDAAQINPLKTSAHWMGGLSYSLIQDGKINLELSGLYSHSRSRQPRTLIGQKANGVFVIVVVDGRSDTSLGVTAQQSAEIMLELGCVEAANADGGGSSALSIFDGNSVKVVSKPSEKVERAVGTCLMIYRK
jgi:exopolysaccharide biosynthesis protein